MLLVRPATTAPATDRGLGTRPVLVARSLPLAPPSSLVSFNYLSLVWATILGFAVWGDVPTPGLLVGSAIVVASARGFDGSADRGEEPAERRNRT
jgi:hypothetical protein